MDSELGFSLGGQQSQAEIQAQLDFFRARAAGIVKQSVYIAAILWSGKFSLGLLKLNSNILT